jgi:sulfite reductase alpha subunit-like flavoprotein
MTTVVAILQKIVILYGGELSFDIANALKDKLLLLPSPTTSTTTTSTSKNALLFSTDQVKLISMSSAREFKTIVDEPSSTLVIVVAQTIENNAPPEEAGPCVRFLNRKTLASNSSCQFQFAILGLGDSNLLLDRQHTTAKDCNAVAQGLDTRLEQLGATRYSPRGEADERTGLLTDVVEAWMQGLVVTVVLTSSSSVSSS